jgi:hypothetical protein
VSASQSRITTAEELDALPVGSVIRDKVGQVTEKVRPLRDQNVRDWQFVGYLGTHAIDHSAFPVTVLHNPAAPPVSDTTAATITREYQEAVEKVRQSCPSDVLAALGLTVTDETGPSA